MAENRERETTALLALLRIATASRVTWSSVVADVLELGSAVAALERIVPTSLFGDDAETHHQEARDTIRAWQRDGAEFVTVLDERYPARLREIHEAPPLLFYRGDLRENDRSVSVVGSRKASASGLAVAEDVAARLVADGVTVVAGLAAGIDTAAHRAALEAGGRTVAVIGTGIRRSYPAENSELQERIAADGLLLSQFYPDAPPTKSSFPRRNATMSGYGIATVIVEAGETSGARIQARVAVEHGRPVILTDTVVDRNDWAKRLIDRPGVYVATGAAQIEHHVRTVDREAADLVETFACPGA